MRNISFLKSFSRSSSAGGSGPGSLMRLFVVKLFAQAALTGFHTLGFVI